MKKYVPVSAEILKASHEIIATSGETLYSLNSKIGDIVVPTQVVDSAEIFR